MVHRHRRDHAGERLRHHVGGVEAAAEADLQQQHVGRALGEEVEGGGRCHLEEGDGRPVVDPLAMLQRGGELGLVHEAAAAFGAEPDALVEAHEMGRGVDVDALAGRLQHRAHEGDGGALAVGAADVDHRRDAVLRPAELLQQGLDPLQREVDLLGMERGQALQDGVGRRGGLQLHAAAASPRFLSSGSGEGARPRNAL